RFFMILDSDRDGLLSADELTRASQLMTELDRDQNGKLDLGELMGFGGRGMGGPEGRPGMRGPGDSDRPDRPRRPDMAGGATPPPQKDRPARPNLRAASNDEFAKRFLERFDRNQDGFLSQEEAPERMRGNFERLDTDGDDRVSAEEMTAALRRRSRD
ncbi:MAG: hypothetical protein HUJ26_20455, partial [Planctomycetaceae bacterium]|nr:hypothetical protein [Planctomycetaceae bacterium]